MNTLQEIAAVLKRLKRAVIFTHMRPDGDTLGCAAALHRALSFLGIESEMVNEGELPARFAFLPTMREFSRAPSPEAEAHADVYICVDASDDTRLGELCRVFRKGANKKITVNIDHHIANTRFCRYNFVRERSSNCENILALIDLLGVPLDRETAECLMAGIVTDSGGFTHGDVDGETFRAAGRLADAGADVSVISYEIYRKQTKARSELYAETVSSIRYLLENKLAIAVVTREMMERYALQTDATEGIVDFALNVDTVEVSICLLEMKRGCYKASLRSKGRADVNRIASVFGGGGHVLASGCMLFGELEEVCERLGDAVYRYTE